MLTATGVARADLEAEGRRFVRHDGRQVLLVAEGGHIFAIANHCPHEGYPQSEGTLGPGCVGTSISPAAERSSAAIRCAATLEDTTRATFRLYCGEDAKFYHFAMELKPVALTLWRMGCNGVATR
jgi:nitrite reductase/ring-hydroxylating ferredoxin subunit